MVLLTEPSPTLTLRKLGPLLAGLRQHGRRRHWYEILSVGQKRFHDDEGVYYRIVFSFRPSQYEGSLCTFFGSKTANPAKTRTCRFVSPNTLKKWTLKSHQLIDFLLSKKSLVFVESHSST